jgi:hypothetical protein
MGKTATIHVRIEEELKAQAHKVLGLLGVSPTGVITTARSSCDRGYRSSSAFERRHPPRHN